ncbi:hypothetical protein [Roseateles sp. P5_E7]
MSEAITDDEAYEGAYRVFWQAVEMLSLAVVEQCNAMGNYNVAWELKDDVSAGAFVVTSSVCPLNATQRHSIDELINDLQGVPPELLVQATSAKANQSAMGHACWEPIRAKAAKVLRGLPAPTSSK